jgi:ferredoxin
MHHRQTPKGLISVGKDSQKTTGPTQILTLGVTVKIYIDKNKCQGSGECLKVCPHRALQLIDGKAVVDHGRCDLDGLCIPACPRDAIVIVEEA